MNLRFGIAMSLLSGALGTSCMRRTATPDLGLNGLTSPVSPKSQAKSPPDASLRAVFKQQAEGTFNPLGGDPHVQELQARLKANSNDVMARLQLGVVYERYKLYDSALDQYKAPLRQSAPADALFEQAAVGVSRSARASHRVAEATPIVETALIQRPTANAWNELGLLYEDSGSFAAAESVFEKALAMKPESNSAHNKLGYCLP